MPIVFKANDSPSQGRDVEILETGHCELRRRTLATGERLAEKVGPEDLVWIMVLSGHGTLGDSAIGGSSAILAGPDSRLDMEASETLDLLWARVPQARRFDPDIGPGNGIRIVDWSREPVLQSEHDTRTRIYLTTPALSGSTAVKAEVITYPAGAAAPEHYHEGAEHFQFVISGAGTAVLNGVDQPLVAGDVLYNYPNEWHYFHTDPAAPEPFVFVELFIPGQCTTIWAEDAKACAWLPTGKDLRGDAPVREIAYHKHGEDVGL